MEELNVPIFSQAKIEYTNQLIDVLYPHMYDGIKSIYSESKIIYSKKTAFHEKKICMVTKPKNIR